MVKIYTTNSCHSCKKAIDFLKKENIPYIEKNISSCLLDDNEIREILIKSRNGTDDIISKRSKVILENNIDIEDMTVNELIEFIKKNPTVLKRPIIFNDATMQVGYNAEDIEVFIPNKLARILKCPCGPDCEHYKEGCDK